MYVTRPRSLYRNFPGALSVQPQPDAPFSGNLVLSDEDSESIGSFCCGIWRNHRINTLPFPSDRILEVFHSSLHEEAAIVRKIWFVPVLDKPLSSNRYYAIKAKGTRKGEAYTCSKEGEVGMCCFSNPGMDPKTRPFDHRDRYQQFEIRPYQGGGFFAQSVEWDGYPPSFLRRGGWEVQESHSFKLRLSEARGLQDSTKSDFSELNFPLHSKRSTPVVLGKWHCPFVFVKEERKKIFRADDQMKESFVYELSLKQWWEQIHYAEKNDDSNRDNVVVVDARVKRLFCLVNGVDGERDHERRDGDSGFVWFKVKKEDCKMRRRVVSVGLSCGLFEKMRWMQERRGWFDNREIDVRVSGNKEKHGWRKFGCYVLVESFVLRRMDGSLLINFNFRNTDMIECKWE
ncbi:hypothetical protein ABFS82_08G038100 [Erythranthe guttata]|uniref:Uncharacterized protein n=1 Tax=Erythranthe guttata TaxID=4155 RepID=A0A022RWD5_ERYGU|nr:PREDICTED: uncharacterized protein LOC105971913 isoform X2 [Erythranthe guttata]EYU44276.1 hypothetical protein MIMGU_mgv1a007642mg [Erythranthe guttata]|eukprot:XP_012852307.1 PREDICTED: uncharacterized protein LOC105971913 isoform X2 [Erythranthe guttata]